MLDASAGAIGLSPACAAFNDRRGYITPKQYRYIRLAMKREIAISHGA